MKQIQYSFKRYEKKFLLTEEQLKSILPEFEKRMEGDEYGIHTICNIYYDTNDYELIRNSLSRPAYKEKFRIRSYGVPSESSVIFAEIKKKFDGVVYKRRVGGAYGDINSLVSSGRAIDDNKQIQNEIRWFLHTHSPRPRVFIGYERRAYAEKDGGDLRVTFDKNIRFRQNKLDLLEGDSGELIIPDNKIVMEIKFPSAAPLWLIRLLESNGIYPTTFSKYGTCYQNHILPESREIHPICGEQFEINLEERLLTDYNLKRKFA